jgi:hypothetical protein
VPDVLAVALVSFGPNGFGAYQADGTKMNAASAANYSADEQANAGDHSAAGNGVYVMAPRRESPGNYFDDIVMWQTQKMLFSAIGGSFFADCGSNTHRHCP